MFPEYSVYRTFIIKNALFEKRCDKPDIVETRNFPEKERFSRDYEKKEEPIFLRTFGDRYNLYIKLKAQHSNNTGQVS